MRRWFTIGALYAAILLVASLLGGLNGFLVALSFGVIVLLYITAMSFLGSFVTSCATRYVRRRTERP